MIFILDTISCRPIAKQNPWNCIITHFSLRQTWPRLFSRGSHFSAVTCCAPVHLNLPRVNKKYCSAFSYLHLQNKRYTLILYPTNMDVALPWPAPKYAQAYFVGAFLNYLPRNSVNIQCCHGELTVKYQQVCADFDDEAQSPAVHLHRRNEGLKSKFTQLQITN
jgi:hypothetical protein